MNIGDSRRLRYTLEKMKELTLKSSDMVNWYFYPNGGENGEPTVRGGYNRWLVVVGGDDHVSDCKADAEYASMSMTVIPQLLETIEQLQREKAELIEVVKFYADHRNYSSMDTNRITGNKVYDIILFDFDRDFKKKKDYAGKKARELLKKLEGV